MNTSANPTSTATLMERVLYEVKRVVVGQDRFLERVMIAMLAQGYLLVEGKPETGGDALSMTYDFGYLASSAIFVVPMVLLIAAQIRADIEEARRLGADLFLSIHADSEEGSDGRGASRRHGDKYGTEHECGTRRGSRAASGPAGASAPCRIEGRAGNG